MVSLTGEVMAVHPNEALLRKGYEAFAKADLDTIQGLFADDVVWHIPGKSPIAGTYKGRDEVLGFLGEVISRSEGTFSLDLHDVLASDDHAVALTRSSAQRQGRTLDVPGTATYHVRDGKVAEAWIFSGDQSAEDEFWS